MSERELEDERQSGSQRTPRGADDRRSAVRPADDPAPVSPEADREAVEKGEDVLERVKPY